MRAWLIVAWVVLTATRVHADEKYQLTAWNIVIKAGDSRVKLTVFGGDPNVMLPACRCAAGLFTLNKETATHFTGTLDKPSFNHKRAATKQLAVKVRKTRHLMGVHRDYRAALHAILRGSGQLFVREVTGGEWEVVGFAPEPLGDVFATRWKSDAKKPPKPAPATPIIDPAADAAALAKLINDYRASIELPRVPMSAKLTKVAAAHVRDLNEHKPTSEKCNMHSWSKHGPWSACCYDRSKAAARCMWAKPKEIAGYKGSGYEIAASASGIAPAQALEQWQKSPLHHEVMINKRIWTKPWKAIGVAIEGDYAVAWFGEETDTK
jgi:hypothetical protein